MEPTHTDAEDEPTAGEHVDRGAFLGEDARVALRQDEDAGGQFDRGGVCTDPGEPGQRIGHGCHLVAGHAPVLAVRVLRDVALRHDGVLDGPETLEAVGLGRLSDGGGGLGVHIGADVREDDSEIHCHTL